MKKFFFLMLLSFSAYSSNLESWIEFQEKASWQKLLKNLSPAGANTGVVIASPQRVNPDYFFHWV
ncbi:MAG: glycoside hydrolase family 15 protein, partial [Proteobacteria bacterium]|nr:glycoside hydrolase family 15 protein [Pseudomonadota bacterium]